jgi:hypothetical protein
MAWSMFHETNAGSGIVGGFAWSNPSGITTRIARGLALVYDGAVAAPGSPWKVVILKANTDLAHAARDATNPRIDRVSLSYALADDTPVTLGRSGGAAEASTNTQAGSVATLVITAGIPGASPTAPALPSGNLHLYDVIVPTATALVALDYRDMAPGPSNRPFDVPLKISGPVTEEAFLIAALYANKSLYTGDASFQSNINWDMLEDWPYYNRGRIAAGEYNNRLYPMLCPLDRSWARNIALGAGFASRYGSGSASDVAVIGRGPYLELVDVAGSGVSDGSIAWAFPVEGRALEITDLRLTAKEVAAFSTVNTLSFDLVVLHADGTTTVIATHDLNTLATGTMTQLVGSTDFNTFATAFLAEGDALYGLLTWDFGACTAGELHLVSLSVTFKEGRTA